MFTSVLLGHILASNSAKMAIMAVVFLGPLLVLRGSAANVSRLASARLGLFVGLSNARGSAVLTTACAWGFLFLLLQVYMDESKMW